MTSSVTRRRIQFPPIPIMPLLTVILVCLLLSPSDEIAITGIFLTLASLMCVTFAVSGIKVVEEKNRETEIGLA